MHLNFGVTLKTFESCANLRSELAIPVNYVTYLIGPEYLCEVVLR